MRLLKKCSYTLICAHILDLSLGKYSCNWHSFAIFPTNIAIYTAFFSSLVNIFTAQNLPTKANYQVFSKIPNKKLNDLKSTPSPVVSMDLKLINLALLII